MNNPGEEREEEIRMTDTQKATQTRSRPHHIDCKVIVSIWNTKNPYYRCIGKALPSFSELYDTHMSCYDPGSSPSDLRLADVCGLVAWARRVIQQNICGRAISDCPEL